MSSPDRLDVLDQLRDRIAVGPAPVAAILAGGRSRRRRTRVALVAVTAAVVAGVLIVGQARTPDRSTEVVDLPEIGASWWSDGVLHVGVQTVEIDDVTHLVSTSTGAIVQTADGMVRSVVDGEVTEIGTKQPHSSFLVDPVRGWVAWPQPDSVIVVFDPATEAEVAREKAKQGGWSATTEQVIVVEDGVLTYDNRAGNRIWDIDADTHRLLGNGASYLMAQRGEVQLVLPLDGPPGEATALLRSGQELWRHPDPGLAWVIAPGGGLLLGVDTETGEVSALDTETGQAQPTGLPSGGGIMSAAFVATTEVVYAVPDGPKVDLLLCSLPGPEATCEKAREGLSSVVLPDTFWANPIVNAS